VQLVVVPTTGDTLVVTQWADLDLDNECGMARELAFADKRVAELNLAWDAQQIAESMGPVWTWPPSSISTKCRRRWTGRMPAQRRGTSAILFPRRRSSPRSTTTEQHSSLV
jgi:hypothetical protein